MESIILSRVILGLVCVINLFIGYAGVKGFVKRTISKKAWISFLIVEVVLITAYILYDNLFVGCHPQDGWVVAILGYLFVYFMAFLAWYVYKDNTLLKKNEIYPFYRVGLAEYADGEFIKGVVEADGKDVVVFLPQKGLPKNLPENIWVRFRSVEREGILVSKVDLPPE